MRVALWIPMESRKSEMALLLALAEELQNVSRKRAFQVGGVAALRGGLAARTPIASRLRSKRGSWAPT